MRIFAATLLFAAAFAQESGYWDSFALDTADKEQTQFLTNKSVHDDVINEIMADINESGLGRSL